MLLPSITVNSQPTKYKYVPESIQYTKKQLTNGNYEGTVNANGIPHGLGTLMFSNNSNGLYRYRGQWTNGLIEGFGFKEWNSPDWYVGELKSNRMTGIGFFVWESGSQYFGQWNNDLQNGIGFSQNGYKKDFGYWTNGKLTMSLRDYAKKKYNEDPRLKALQSQEAKTVTELSTELGTYTGGWSNGTMSGYGMMDDGSMIIIGEWLNSVCQHDGKTYTCNYYDGVWIEETYKDGARIGEYIYYCRDFFLKLNLNNDSIGTGFMIRGRKPFDKYTGEFLLGLDAIYLNGWAAVFNTYYIQEGERRSFVNSGPLRGYTLDGIYYEGDFEGGTGIGRIVYPQGSKQVKYEGEIKVSDDYLPDGNGKMYYLDKNIYEGQWKKGMREGQGKLMFSDGEIIQQGSWSNDVFLTR
jgi:hypothetical protein